MIFDKSSIIFIVALIFSIGSVCSTVLKYNVPYDFLATRVAYDVLLMDSMVERQKLDLFNAFCNNQTCYAAIFNRPNEPPRFQFLIDVQSDCQTFPNCLAFTEEEYNETIVFYYENPKPDKDICLSPEGLRSAMSSKFEIASCPSDFNYSFKRANGRTWCWMFEVVNRLPFAEARERCQSLNAELNGFQSDEERTYFMTTLNDTIEKTPYQLWYMLLGAKRDVDCNYNWTCANTELMKWIGNVSSNDTLANDYKRRYDGNGKALSFSIPQQIYDDMPITSACIYTCGKYADQFTSGVFSVSTYYKKPDK